MDSEKARRDGKEGRIPSASTPNTITLVIIHGYFSDRGLGLKVTSLHYRLLAHISNLGGPSCELAQEVRLTGKPTGLHQAVMRLACWFCRKQERTQRAALRRLADDEV